MFRILSDGKQKGAYIAKDFFNGGKAEHEIVLPRKTPLKIVKKDTIKLESRKCNLITVVPA